MNLQSSAAIPGTVAAQRAFFRTEATKPIAFRKEQLRRLRAMLQHHEQLLMQAVRDDFGKSEYECFLIEFSGLYKEIDGAIRRVGRWAKPKRVPTNLVNQPGRSWILPEPLGTALVIGAWNYPINIALTPVVGAMAAGCTVVLKPSELAPNTAEALRKAVAEFFSPEYFTVVEGGVPQTTLLLEQPFDKIFFTGSVPVGRIVYEAAARQLIPVTLELGGKSPAIITEDCNLPIVARRLVWAKFLNAGQTCIAPDYILVHRSVKDRLLEHLRTEIEAADYSVENGNYVRIINDRNMTRLVGLIDPEKVYLGGIYNSEQRFLAPTVLTGVTPQDRVMAEEIFGPLLPILEYSDLQEAIDLIKDRPKPLACYIFTENRRIRNRLLSEISSGGCAVNDAVMHFTNDRLPFGGVGASGIGNYHGEAGFRTFSHYKSTLIRPTWFEPSLKYAPYTVRKLKWLRRLTKL